MPGRAEPQGKNSRRYVQGEADDAEETSTAPLSVAADEFAQLPPTRVGSVDQGEIDKSPPLVFYVEDKTQGRLRVAAAVLLGVLLGLVMLGNWLQTWEPAPAPAAEGDLLLTNGAPTSVVPLPVDRAEERGVRPSERAEAAAQF